ncbi:hypothetical protein [Mangrovimonas futianensis]|uniref:hypothetical protein n=1 Tax=Mangrovimonas futianensis TaxID=2895523 RepID=UPI001E3904C3|nr:hypothetical protein [Mangrovimonas futianensis]MCF1420267.1 hypothetical protein [Mangrovimonas futianensis]
MKGSLKPTFAKYIGGNYIIWFEKTNQYVIASDFLYHLITIFLNSENITEFKRHNKSTFDEAQARLTYKELSSFLYEANSLQVESIPNIKFSDTKLDLTPVSNYYYYIGEKSLNLRFSDDPIFNLIKERLSQFKVRKANENLICFDFKISNGIAYLEKQGQLIAKYPYSKMHYLFGKFSMELISNLYSFPTTSWLATLHASTVCDENQAIMLVGESGNGKSTLAGLCLLNGYHF